MNRARYLRFGEVTMDLEEHAVLREGLKSQVPEEYWKALMLLVERKPKLVTKQELYDVLGTVADGTLTKQIQRIREALGDTRRPFRFIKSERHQGYKWIAELDGQIATKSARVASRYIHPTVIFRKRALFGLSIVMTSRTSPLHSKSSAAITNTSTCMTRLENETPEGRCFSEFPFWGAWHSGHFRIQSFGKIAYL